MKQIIPILLLAVSVNACAQYDYRGSEYFNHEEEVTMYLEADNESRKSQDKEHYIYRLLKVNVNTESGMTEMTRKELGTGENSEVSFEFGQEFISYTKKYVVLKGKSSFYVYDIRNKNLSSELYPIRIKTIADTVETEISEINVAENGTYLYGTFMGGGSFMYDVCDIENLKQMPSANNPIFTDSRLYLIKNCENPELVTGSYVSQYEGETVFKKLFENKTLYSAPEAKIEYTDEEIEEAIVSADIHGQRFCILEEKPGDYIVVDIFVGRIHSLPSGRHFSNSDELMQFLIDEEIKRKEEEAKEYEE